MAPFRLMRKGVLLGLRRLPLITDSYCSPRQPPTPCHSKAFRFLCASVLIVAPSMLASSTGVSTVYGYHSVAMPDSISCCRCFVLLSSYPLLCIVRFFIQPGVRVLLFATSKCKDDSFRPPIPSVCPTPVRGYPWLAPSIIAPFSLRHSQFSSSFMFFFHEATSFSRCKGSMPAHFMGTGQHAYGQCFDENLPFSFHGQQKVYLHEKSLAHPLQAQLLSHL